MHEMSLAEGILQIIEDAAHHQGFAKVKTVFLEIGQLASVEVEAMRFCFDVVLNGSIAEGAKLEIVSLPGSGWCMKCAMTVPIVEQYGACPQCGSYQVQPVGGTEMRVKELEVE
jgi:hydrogenase nickel incorporation protein HypA/HybF